VTFVLVSPKIRLLLASFRSNACYNTLCSWELKASRNEPQFIVSSKVSFNLNYHGKQERINTRFLFTVLSLELGTKYTYLVSHACVCLT
jgi:hypothetical protein